MADVGVILAEDEALRVKFGDLYVPAPKSETGKVRAKSWFGMGSGERERTYPFISVDLVDVRFASERAHSLEAINVDWWPSEGSTFQEYADLRGLTTDPEAPYATTIRFQPYDLYYQVATHCRYSVQDRYLSAQILTLDYAPLSQLGSLHVPADGTDRWLDNEGWTRADYLDTEEKVVHRKIYNLKVSAHMALTDPHSYEKVLSVAATLRGITDGEEYSAWEHAAPA